MKSVKTLSLSLSLSPSGTDMDLGLDFRVAGIELTKRVHFGIQRLSDPDEKPRRFFREVLVVVIISCIE